MIYVKVKTPNLGWEILISNIRITLDKLYPIKELKNFRTKAGWVTSEIFELMKLRDELYKKASYTNQEVDWQIAKQHRNIVNSMCKAAKREHSKNKIINNSENSSKF